MTELPSLTAIVPVCNEQAWIAESLRRLRQALELSPWRGSRIVVVDDGSTDGTSELLTKLSEPLGLDVVSQPNGGRLAARAAGLAATDAELALLVDARVFVDAGALAHVAAEMAADASARIWNGDVTVASESNPYAGFWSALTMIGWRRWFAHRTRTSYGLADFDLYPKGTTMFLAPRKWLVDDSAALSSRYDDAHLRSDDTALIRRLALRGRIHLSAGFSCRYHGRDALVPFLKHAYWRGTTFVDAYFGRPGPVGRALTAGLLFSPLLSWVAVRRPGRAAQGTVVVLSAAAVAARRSGAPWRDAGSLVVLAPTFGVAFAGGLARGVVLAAVTSARRRAAE